MRHDADKTARIKRRELALVLAIIGIVALAVIAETDAQARRGSALDAPAVTRTA